MQTVVAEPCLHQVLVHTTSKCNLRCKHCYASDQSGGLRSDELSRLFDESKDLGASMCHLSGGEFFTRDDWRQVLGMATERFSVVEITTNGQLVDQATVSALSTERLSKLIISLEGHNAELNDLIRGEGSFDQAVRAIGLCADAGLNVGVNYTVSKYNVKYVELMADFAVGIGAKFVNFRRFIPTGTGAMAREMAPGKKEYLELARTIIKIRKRLATVAMAGDPIRIILDKELLCKTEFSGCMAGIAMLAVKSNGDVIPCGYLDLPAGNIRNESLKAIWEDSEIMRSLRVRTSVKGKCGGCKNVLKCGGCRASAYATSGDPFGEDPQCWTE